MAPTKVEYAKINIACKQLGIDKYGLLADRYGIESSKQLTRQQTIDLLNHFKSLGWRPQRKKNSKTSPKYPDPMMRKVVALWITLAQAGVVRDKSDQALQKFVKKQTKVENLKWCDGYQLNQLIETLKAWGQREEIDLE